MWLCGTGEEVPGAFQPAALGRNGGQDWQREPLKPPGWKVGEMLRCVRSTQVFPVA